MRSWSARSKEVYEELDERLQLLVTRLRDEVMDITLLDGARTKAEQDHYNSIGTSTVKWPNSKHNTYPSIAVDLQPYPYPDYEPKLWGALGYLAGRAHAIATEEGFRIRWGGDWNGNGDLTDQTFDDLFHIEVLDEETTVESAG